MKNRTTASMVLKLMSPAQRQALLEYSYARWESDVQSGDLDEILAGREDISREDLAEAMGYIRREVLGVVR